MFEVRLTRQPQRYLAKAPEGARGRLQACFERLEAEPFRIAEPLHGPLQGMWKTRVGGLRLILEIDIDTKRIRIIYIGARGDVY